MRDLARPQRPPRANASRLMGELLDIFHRRDDGEDRRPAITHNRRQLDAVVDDALDALAAANEPPRLFVRGGQLARVRTDEQGHPIIEAVDAVRCRDELARAARWYTTFSDAPMRPSYPPAEVAATVCARGDWPLPPLAGIVEHPVLRPDGTFALDHGYDPATKLYHWHRGAPYAPIPEHPSAHQLAAAVALVDEALCDFPWDTTADRANAWGLLVTQLVRPIVGQVPMALVDAPSPGTGKTLLVNVHGLIVHGNHGAMMPWPRNDEELEKKVSSLLMAGTTTVVWDNIEGVIRSEVLASVLTADVWRGRVLGASQMVALPNGATWIATGNNLSVGGDLARRCYRVRLDAHHAQPWQREGFRHPDLEGWVRQHRSELLGALCTIVRSWWVAGRPLAASIAAMGGFTGWARTVGGILAHAGIDGFLANLAAFVAEADLDAQQWEAFLGAWSDGWGEQPQTVADLVASMEGGSSAGSDLKATLPDELAGAWGSGGFTRKLGHALRKRVGRHYGADGAHLIECPKHRRKVATYAVTTRPVQVFESVRGDADDIPAEHVENVLVDESVQGSRGCSSLPHVGFLEKPLWDRDTSRRTPHPRDPQEPVENPF